MTTRVQGNGSWSIDVRADPIEVTSSLPTADESWRFTDTQGHEHRYEHGYPTLELVIDAEHWCNGNEGFMRHDPHMAVDEAHYECLICREVIAPAEHSGGYRRFISGPREATLRATRADGSKIVAWLTEPDLEAIQSVSEAEIDAFMAGFVDNLPDGQISGITLRQ